MNSYDVGLLTMLLHSNPLFFNPGLQANKSLDVASAQNEKYGEAVVMKAEVHTAPTILRHFTSNH